MREPNFKYFDEADEPNAVAIAEPTDESEDDYAPQQSTPRWADLRANLTVLPPLEADEKEFEEAVAAALLPHELIAEIEKSTPENRRDFLARLSIALAPIYGAVYDWQMRRGGVKLVRQRVQMSGIARTAPALRAAFISDLHYGPTSGHVAARQAWKILHEAQPDVLILGGDYLYADHRGLPAFLRELQRWKWNAPRAGIYAVLGNHDYNCDTAALTMAMEACGVRILKNESVRLPDPWNSIHLAGLDDFRNGTPDIKATLADVPRGDCAIMVSHSPDACELPDLKRCGLTLCGHTHGGQVCYPNGDVPYVPGKWGKHFPWGMHRHAGNWVFVSRGVGTVGLPIRAFAPPDVALFEIVGRGAAITP